MRLAFRVAVDPTAVFVFTPPLYELGADFLYVDGRCNYWVQKPSVPPHDEYRAWRAYRHGILTEAQESALHDLTSYDVFGHGAPGCTNVGATDGASSEFWDGSKVNRCVGSITASEDWPMRSALFEAGQPMADAMRFEVGLDRPPDDAPLYDWPLAASPASIATDYQKGSQFGQTTLVSDPTETAALRSLRDKALADAEVSPGLFYGLIFVAPKGYAFSLRDDLPFTDKVTGLWSTP